MYPYYSRFNLNGLFFLQCSTMITTIILYLPNAVGIAHGLHMLRFKYCLLISQCDHDEQKNTIRNVIGQKLLDCLRHVDCYL